METGNPAPPAPAVIQTPVTIDPVAIAAAVNEAIRQSQAKEQLPPEETAKILKARLTSLQERQEFKIGDLVTWKPGLKNKRYPYDNQPAIVIQILDDPLIDPRDVPVSPYFREPLDIVLGVLSDDGSFATFYYDKRRFMVFSKG
jgi:hypothetical protein